MQNFVGSASPGLRLAGHAIGEIWDAGASYVRGAIVIDRGGFWQATIANANSRPISGNADWTLVGGEPYLQAQPSPSELTSLPFYDPGAAGDGYVLVPGVPGYIIQPLAILQLTTAGAPWNSNAEVVYYVGTPGAGSVLTDVWPYFATPDDQLGTVPFPTDILSFGSVPFVVSGAKSMRFDIPPAAANIYTPDFAGLPITVITTTDITNSGTTFGSRTIIFRIYYRLLPVSFGTAYYVVGDVDQGTQTFTLVGTDATGLTAFTVFGSTGNDGSYTAASVSSFYPNSSAQTDAIAGVSQLDQTFTVSGTNVAAAYPAGSIATVSGSTGNDGDYTVVSAVFSGGDTIITVEEAIPDATVDGDILEPNATDLIVNEAIPSSTADGWATAG